MGIPSLRLQVQAQAREMQRDASLSSLESKGKARYNYNPEPYWKPTNVDIVAKHLQNNTPEDQIEKYMQYIINQHEQ